MCVCVCPSLVFDYSLICIRIRQHLQPRIGHRASGKIQQGTGGRERERTFFLRLPWGYPEMHLCLPLFLWPVSLLISRTSKYTYLRSSAIAESEPGWREDSTRYRITIYVCMCVCVPLFLWLVPLLSSRIRRHLQPQIGSRAGGKFQQGTGEYIYVCVCVRLPLLSLTTRSYCVIDF